jgi:hypothetical protein
MAQAELERDPQAPAGELGGEGVGLAPGEVVEGAEATGGRLVMVHHFVDAAHAGGIVAQDSRYEAFGFAAGCLGAHRAPPAATRGRTTETEKEQAVDAGEIVWHRLTLPTLQKIPP